MVIRVQDTGPGFCFERKTSELEENRDNSGRGLALVRTICDQVVYLGNGNVVEASFSWEKG